MGFLTKALTGVGLALTGAQAFRSFRGPKTPAGFDEAVTQSMRIRDALLQGAGNPLFDELAAEEEEEIRGDLQEGMRELRIADRRQRARTGIGILSSERRDEAISQALSRGFSDAKQKARDNTRNYLSQALSANNAVLSATGQQAAINTADFNRGQQGLGALAQAAFGVSQGMQENSRADEFLKLIGNQGLLTGATSATVNPTTRALPSIDRSPSRAFAVGSV